GDRFFGQIVHFADPEALRVFDFHFVAGNAATALAEPTSAIVTERAAELLFGTRDALNRTFSVSRQVNRPVDVIVRGIVAESPRGLSTLRFPSENGGILLNESVREALLPAGGTGADWSNDDFGAMTFALLPADGSLPAAELDRRLAALAERIDPGNGDEISLRARPLSKVFDDQITSVLSSLGIFSTLSAGYLVFLPGLLILGMACYNYINLTVAIAASRAKEVGLCKVLGASDRQVIQQHLLEAAAAVAIAFVLALALAALLVAALDNAFDFSIPFAGVLGPRFWLAAASIVSATTLIAGAYPAWVMSRFLPIETLRIGTKRSGSSVLRSVFIGGQFAVASVLLTAVLVMYAQNAAMRLELERLPTDPYVQLDNNLLETPEVDPAVLDAALRASPAIRGVTGMADGFWSITLTAEPFSRTRTRRGAVRCPRRG
ncbi:MAG TPA: ABC transporter permease, partial [Gammaproteobacteria bacterium]|nr:ABC transporter permease [Gammaproteobacteria bacterium]